MAEIKKKQSEINKQEKYYYKYYKYDCAIKRIRELIEDLKSYSIPKREQHTFLQGSWKQIKGLLRSLSYEKYIDDQIEIDEIWKICEALIKRGRFSEETWKVKEEILIEIYKNYFYDAYGCYDQMYDLSNAICISAEENIKRATIMAKFGGREARKAGDEVMFNKLKLSAHRRRSINAKKVDEYFA